MTITENDIIYELLDFGNHKKVKIIKCLSRKSKITIPSTVSFSDTNGNNAYEVQIVAANAFKNCENLRYICFDKPDIITDIGKSAFENCISLKFFNIPSQVKYINSRCFYNCISLKEIKSSGPIERIGASAFEKCKSLKTLSGIDTSNLQYIDEDTFKNCFYLSVNMKIDSLKEIKENAFDKCNNSIITGNLLSYNNGEKYEKLNSNIKGKWKAPLKSLIPFFISLGLFVIMCGLFAFMDLKNSQLAKSFFIVILMFLMLSFSIPCFLEYKYKNNVWSMTIATFLWAIVPILGAFLISTLIPNDNCFNSIRMDKPNNDSYYAVSVDQYESHSDYMIKYINKEIRSCINNQTNNDKIFNEQQIQIISEKNVLAEIFNNPDLNNIIENVDLDFTKNKTKISLTTKGERNGIQLYIDYGNGSPIELKFDNQNNCCQDIDNNAYFSILAITDSSKQSPYEALLNFRIYKTARTSENTILSFFILLPVFLSGFFLFLTIVYLICSIYKMQSFIANNKIVISIVALIISFISSLILKNSLVDAFYSISSVISQY